MFSQVYKVDFHRDMLWPVVFSLAKLIALVYPEHPRTAELFVKAKLIPLVQSFSTAVMSKGLSPKPASPSPPAGSGSALLPFFKK